MRHRPVKLLGKRILGRFWRLWVHFRGKVGLSRWATDQAYRETFFDLAFKTLVYNGIDGDYVEFGCGRSFVYAYEYARRHGHKCKMWGFDSFEGLPASQGEVDDHPMWKEGVFATDLDVFRKYLRGSRVPDSEYTLTKGFFEDTLTKLGPTDAPANICLANIDCDLYSACMTVLRFLEPRLKHGMILIFDDYFCWSPRQIGSNRRAYLEFFENHERWRLVSYRGYGWQGATYMVEDKTLFAAT